MIAGQKWRGPKGRAPGRAQQAGAWGAAPRRAPWQAQGAGAGAAPAVQGPAFAKVAPLAGAPEGVLLRRGRRRKRGGGGCGGRPSPVSYKPWSKLHPLPLAKTRPRRRPGGAAHHSGVRRRWAAGARGWKNGAGAARARCPADCLAAAAPSARGRVPVGRSVPSKTGDRGRGPIVVPRPFELQGDVGGYRHAARKKNSLLVQYKNCCLADCAARAQYKARRSSFAGLSAGRCVLVRGQRKLLRACRHDAKRGASAGGPSGSPAARAPGPGCCLKPPQGP